MTPDNASGSQKILIVKPSSPGDIIHALPVARRLRAAMPESHISWLIATSFINLLEREPSIDELIPFDRKRYGHLGRNLTASTEFMRFLSELRRKKFDLVVDLQGLFRSGFLTYATGAKKRIGFLSARELAWVFYNERVRIENADLHAVERNLRVADAICSVNGPVDTRIAFDDADREKAAAIRRDFGLSPDEPYVVLVPATRWETKQWPIERIGMLAAEIKNQFELPSVLVGGPGDRDLADQAVTASNGIAINLCGKTTLRELVAMIDSSKLVVTADSTPMHIAAAHGVPLVALFGPTNPQRTGPYDRPDTVVRLELECSPCYYRKLRQCPHKHKCMRDLSVDRILDEMDGRLNK